MKLVKQLDIISKLAHKSHSQDQHMPLSGLPIHMLTISSSFFSRRHLLETMEQKKSHFWIRSSAVKLSDKVLPGLYAKFWRRSAELVGGLLESITRLWLTQRGTVHPLNAPSATTVGPKAPGCQPVSTHAWWRVTLKGKGPVAALQPLSERLDQVNSWADATDTRVPVCGNSGKQTGSSCQHFSRQREFWGVCVYPMSA